ncbi:alpha/beta fold hydrolase [Pseudohalioglobus lutimaris]|uniref:Alpha/beta hydrolase n=1 Tax=Pseudohalioglobus lutimaris TaxID=1737061 RepID=A0A2N5X6L9_9GAMM|nr:alpha/beta hydrolase [Pseudohalioglobus lutimaris]PLW70110.1 alpha/beta hydrolase [Pseudohalioglobus lutimaris]
MVEPREFHLDIGDVELAVLEWPGEGDPVLLLHATGFHSRCWSQVVAQLPGQHVFAVDLRYHGRSGSLGDVDWNVLCADIVTLVETLDLQNVVGVGHSIGGYMIARAAAAHPERFKHLLLIDPVIVAREEYDEARKRVATITAADHPVARRKNRWQDAAEMFDRFKDREPFSSWQTEVLRDYCDYALKPANEEGYRELACDPMNEAAVYISQAMSDAVHEDIPRITTPTTLLRARYEGLSITDLSTSPTWPGLAQAITNCQEHYHPEMNHFIPMQDPLLVARHIRQALDV